MIAFAAFRGKMRRGVPRGFFVAAAIVGFGSALGVIALRGKPSAVRRPDPVGRPVLLVADFDNRSGRSDLVVFARRLSETLRERLGREAEGIFELSPRRLRPLLGPREREDGLLRIAARLGADYVLVGSLESGPESPLGPGSAWEAPPSAAGGGDGIRLDVLLVRDADPPEVFAERFPLGPVADREEERNRLAALVADRIALSLRRF